MGEMDARGGMPTIACPECGANKNPTKLLKQKHTKICFKKRKG
jgi:hypothetical protein